jgi:endonuclease YncB( thermonuclease family)
MVPTKVGAIALAVLLWGSLAQGAVDLAGRVVRVTDGDTVVLLDSDKAEHKIRLAGIDAPETGQEFGTKAKQHLLALVGGDPVTVAWQKRDRYGRIVGKLVRDGTDVNLAMVRAGFAWWYQQYANEQAPVDRVLYAAAEGKAKAERLGLWADKAPLAPWDWRHPSAESRTTLECPCGTGAVCVGPKGGRYCVREGGSKRYLSRG